MAIKKVDVDFTKSEDSMEVSGEKELPSMVTELITELVSKPHLAVELVQCLKRITKPWEILGNNGHSINEVPVPPGKSAKEFLKSTQTSAYVSGYRLSTIFGDEVAMIVKDNPKWRITILGEYQVEAPFVSHAQHGEANSKKFVEDKLVEMGYIIPR